MLKLMAIGFDAAESWLVRDLEAAGELPNLSALRARGLSAEFSSPRAFRSEATWTQVLAGRSRHETHYHTNVAIDAGRYAFADRGASGLEPFWAQSGVKFLIFDVPHTALNYDGDGIHVVDWGTHSALFPRSSRPAGLLSRLDAEFGPHPANAQDNTACWFDAGYLEALGKAAQAGAATRVAVLRKLLAENADTDFLFTVMSESHMVGHHAWHGVDPAHPASVHRTGPIAGRIMRETYAAMDAALGAMLGLAGPDTNVLVFSPHGMRSNGNDLPGLVLLPELLFRWQLGRSLMEAPGGKRWAAEGYPPIDPRFSTAKHLGTLFATNPKQRLMRSIWNALPELGKQATAAIRAHLQPQWAEEMVFGTRKPRPELRVPDPGSFDWTASVDYQICNRYSPWWPQMRAFAIPTFSDPHIRVNVKGREGAGIVAPEDYTRVLDEVEALLRALVDPRTGRPAVEGVERTRKGPFDHPDEPAADLVVFMAGVSDAVRHPDFGLIGPVPFFRTGEHTSEGWAVLAGPGIQRGVADSCSPFDLTATMLDLMGGSGRGIAGRSLRAA